MTLVVDAHPLKNTKRAASPMRSETQRESGL